MQPRDEAAPKRAESLADKLARLDIAREEDLVLHLPLRYEDHTRLVPLAQVKVGETVQTEGTVANVDIAYRPRRQLVCRVRSKIDVVAPDSGLFVERCRGTQAQMAQFRRNGQALLELAEAN